MYHVQIERAAERDLTKLPHDIFRRIIPLIKQHFSQSETQGLSLNHGFEKRLSYSIG